MRSARARRAYLLTPAETAARAVRRAASVASDLRSATAATINRRECSTVDAVLALCTTAREFSIGLFPAERIAVATEFRRTADLVEDDGRGRSTNPTDQEVSR